MRTCVGVETGESSTELSEAGPDHQSDNSIDNIKQHPLPHASNIQVSEYVINLNFYLQAVAVNYKNCFSAIKSSLFFKIFISHAAVA